MVHAIIKVETVRMKFGSVGQMSLCIGHCQLCRYCDGSRLIRTRAIVQACIDDNLAMVQFLVEHGADIEANDNEGWTALHATASCGFVDIARYVHTLYSLHIILHVYLVPAMTAVTNSYYNYNNIVMPPTCTGRAL